jgi:DNA helicase-2/ATP-dependent DNA helicase PcrA
VRYTLEQRAILDGRESAKRVIAAAGSGKTAVLVGQAARWSDDPETTLAITFTRRAGAALRDKLEAAGVASPWMVGTVHSYCYRSLARWGHRYTLVDAAELVVIAEYIMGRAGVRSQSTPERLAAMLTHDLKAPRPSDGERMILRLVLAFLAEQGLCYVGDLPRRWLDLAGREPRFLDLCRAQARTVLWDEYQDTNAEDAALLAAIAPRRRFLIGDPSQSIYGFRGASPEFLLRDTGRLFPLTLNWRSGTGIVSYCNAFRLHYMAGAARQVPGRVRIIGLDEDSHTSEELARLAGEGPLVVLCRTNREVARLALALAPLRPLVVSSQTDRFAGPRWRAVYWLCTWLIAPEKSWLRAKVDQLTGDAGAVQVRGFTTAAEVASWLGMVPGPDDAALLDCTLEEFAAWYMARDLQDQLPDGEPPGLVLMTAHASKGLEWPAVAVVADRMPLKGQDATQERNLYYVACSRAIDSLAVVGHGGGFMGEIGG